MESEWTSKHAILRDLSLAQGREVPVEIKNTVTKDEKPPALNYTEETEEEFFESCVSNGDFNAGPDITLIQQMLDMVREINVTDVEAVDYNTLIEIRKSPIHHGGADGSQLPVIIKESVETKKKTKGNKNVAVASLIATYGDSTDNEIPQIPKLLKPNHFISGNESNIQINAVKESLKPLKKNIRKDKDVKPVVSPTLMFKKKSPNQKSTQGSLSQNSSPISVKSECFSPSELIKPASFVPSSHAGEYYKKYVERSEMQAEVKEDIWSRAEREMKEIEVGRMQKTFPSQRVVQESCEIGELHGMDYIRLPQHRHKLPEECIVCKVLCSAKAKAT